MTSQPQSPPAKKKCPDCGGLPGLYPNNRCPVCYVKTQHTQSPPPGDELEQILDDFYDEAFIDGLPVAKAQLNAYTLAEVLKLIGPTNGLIGMDDLHPDAYKAQERLKAHLITTATARFGTPADKLQGESE
jgi:hypothetical protein